MVKWSKLVIRLKNKMSYISLESIAGDVTISNTGVTAIGANKVTLAQIATIANNTVLLNISGSAAVPIAGTGANVRTICGLATTDSPVFVGLSLSGAFKTTSTLLITNNGATMADMPGSAGNNNYPFGFILDASDGQCPGLFVYGGTPGLQGWAGYDSGVCCGTRASPANTCNGTQVNSLGGIGYDTVNGWGGNTAAPHPAGVFAVYAAQDFTSTHHGMICTIETVALNDVVANRKPRVQIGAGVAIGSTVCYSGTWTDPGDGNLTLGGGITALALASLTTPIESWVGPSSTTGVYFKGGNVGIGTTDPGAKLEVLGGTSAGLNDALWLSGGAAAEETGPRLVFHEYFGNNAYPTWRLGEVGAVYSYIGSNIYGGALVFNTNTGASTTDISEKMRITTTGNVGIGTTTPNAALTVGSYAGVSGVPASILLGNWNTSTGYPQIVGTWNAAGTWGIGAADAAHQTLQIGLVNGANTASPTWNSGNGMNLYVNGNVGIGTTTPHSKLAVVGLPTSTAGLSSGDIWVDTTGGLNILKIV